MINERNCKKQFNTSKNCDILSIYTEESEVLECNRLQISKK